MARDKIHSIVRKAIENDGWTITDDPLILLPEEDNLGVDLGAERVLLAEKGLEKIAVEIKSFNQPSLMYEFHRAIGQYFDYESALLEANENRVLYAAIPKLIYPKLLNSRVIKRSIERMRMRLIIVDLETEKIEQWINS